MPRVSFPGWYNATQAGARALGWLTSLIAIIIIGYIVRQWPSKFGTVVAGIIGAAIALITDSWEVITILDPSGDRRRRDRPNSTPLKRLVFDILSLGISLGGIILILFDEISYTGYAFPIGDDKEGNEEMRKQVEEDLEKSLVADDGSGYTQMQMTQAGMWILAAVVAWRFIFAFWGCADGARQFRRNERAWRREMEQA